MSRLDTGARVAPHRLVTIKGRTVDVPDRERLTHLQFRRFAGCPVCSLHLREFVKRRQEIAAAGIEEIVLFHSRAEELLRFAAELPIAIVADADKRLYREFGVEAGRRALLDPRAWPGILRAVAASRADIAFRGAPVPSLNPEGGRYGLPADFLIAPDGEVLACRYGAFVDDQWSVDELLAAAAAAGRAPARAAAE